MFLMPIFWLFIIIGIIVVIIAAAQGGTTTAAFTPTETALDILRKRYASGEIGREEFEEKRKVLSGNE